MPCVRHITYHGNPKIGLQFQYQNGKSFKKATHITVAFILKSYSLNRGFEIETKIIKEVFH